jgi:hypothetical protein
LIREHPDTRAALINVPVPQWPRVVDVAVGAARAVGLGYVGVDVAIDDAMGPVILEVNARPGLAVQLANGVGLRSCLDQLDRAAARTGAPEAPVVPALSPDVAAPAVPLCPIEIPAWRSQ